MKAWASYVAAGKAKPEQETKVRAAYSKYQLAMLSVIDAGKVATTSGNQTALQTVVAAAAAAQADLVALVKSFLPPELQPKPQ
jgi:hypothetical protein